MSTTLSSPAASAPRSAVRERIDPFLASTVGKKIVMAATGIVLFGFVVGHMVGNLQVYLGAEALNAYGEFLQEFGHGMGVWVARAGLLAAVGLHVWAAAALTLVNRGARATGYRLERYRESTYASRTMRISGITLALFVVYHLLHLTVGTAHGSFVKGDVYHNVVAGFSSAPVAAIYVAAMIALGFHLYHGAWSMLQTLGLSHPRYDRCRRIFAAVFAGIVVVGNVSIPVAVLAGFVR